MLTAIAPRAMFMPVAALAIAAICTRTAAAELRFVNSVASSKNAAMAKPEQDLEAVALQVLLAPLFNSSRKGSLSKGTAGRHWESMMVEQIARQLAKRGGLRLIPKSVEGGIAAGAVRLAAPSQGPMAEPCRASTCWPEAKIGVWRTSVTVSNAPDSPANAQRVKAGTKTESFP